MYTREELVTALDHVKPYIDKLADGPLTVEELADAQRHLAFLASVPNSNYVHLFGHYCCFMARREARSCPRHGEQEPPRRAGAGAEE